MAVGDDGVVGEEAVAGASAAAAIGDANTEPINTSTKLAVATKRLCFRVNIKLTFFGRADFAEASGCRKTNNEGQQAQFNSKSRK